MDITELSKQITAFRSLNTEAAITPENLGVILQALADLLAKAVTSADLAQIAAWRTNFLRLNTLLQGVGVGTQSHTEKVFLSYTNAVLANGLTQKVSDGIMILPASTEHAGVMTARQAKDLDTCTTSLANLKAINTSNTADVTALKEWKQKISEGQMVLKNIMLGTVSRTSVGISYTLISMASGAYRSLANAVVLPAATTSNAGVMTAAQVEKLNRYYDHVCTVDKAVKTVTDTIPAKFSYDQDARTLAAQNTEGTKLFDVTLPWATPTSPGLMTTQDLLEVQSALNTRVRELGNFDSESAALNKLQDPGIAGNESIIIAHLTYQTHMGITIVQNIENDYCRQIIFNHSKVFQRAIYFTNSKRDTISYAEDWGCLFPDRMTWDRNAHKYVFKQFDLSFNAAYTDAIPMATKDVDGLMSRADKKTLDDLVSKVNALSNK